MVVMIGLWGPVTGGEIDGPIVEVGGGKKGGPKTNGLYYILARSCI